MCSEDAEQGAFYGITRCFAAIVNIFHIIFFNCDSCHVFAEMARNKIFNEKKEKNYEPVDYRRYA